MLGTPTGATLGTITTNTLTIGESNAFSFHAQIKLLTIDASNFYFTQRSTQDTQGVHTTYEVTADGHTEDYADTAVTRILVYGNNAGQAILVTNDTYVGTDGKTHETVETVSLGSKTDNGVGEITKYDANGNPFTFLSLNYFPVSYIYAGRADGTVILYGTAGELYNGFVSAGNYSYIGGPGEFHLAQGATSVYGYSAGQSTDFAYHYSANPGSSYVVSGVAFSYMAGTDTTGGVTQSYFNVGAGFQLNTGVSNNPGKDYAYIIDSPGNDTFVGGTTYSYMYTMDAAGSFTEFDAAYYFALVYGQSFVGGLDTASNGDPNKNIVTGFH